MDATFKVAKKAAVVNPEKAHEILMKGGIMSMINEFNEIIAWVRTISLHPVLSFAYPDPSLALLSVPVDGRNHRDA